MTYNQYIRTKSDDSTPDGASKRINYIQDQLELLVQSSSREVDRLKNSISSLKKRVNILEKKHS